MQVWLRREAEKREEKYLKTIRDRISQYKKFRQTLEEEAKNIGAPSAFDMLKNSEDNKELFDYFASLGLTQDDILNFRKSMTTITAGISGDLMMKGSDEAVENTIKMLDELKSRGYDFETTESSSNSISKNITENQADRLLSYVNAIRADVSVQKFDVTAIRRAVESMAGSNNVLAQVQVQQLRSIVSNTARNAKAAEDIYHALELARSDANFGFYGK